MVTFSDVKVYDADGNIKHIVTIETILKRKWDKIAEEEGLSTQSLFMKSKVYKHDKTICKYKPCSKEVQKTSAKQLFCANRKEPNSCFVQYHKEERRKITNKFKLEISKGNITATCHNCKKEYIQSKIKQKLCRNPCLPKYYKDPNIVPISVICKMCNNEYIQIPNKHTVFCKNPCNYVLWKKQELLSKYVINICLVCNKPFKAPLNRKYCHDPCTKRT